MLQPGTKVLIIGDSNANCGQEVVVSDALVYDNGDNSTTYIYNVAPQQMRDGMKLYFQEQHLMPLDDIPVLELYHLDMLEVV